jgi:hypothetical protein
MDILADVAVLQVARNRFNRHGPSCPGLEGSHCKRKAFQSANLTIVAFGPQTSLAALAASVEKRDWETATRNMQRAMAVDIAVLTSSFAEAVVVSDRLVQY